MPLEAISGEALTEDEIVAEAYAHVAEGYRRALAVGGLSDVERDGLRHCLRCAAEIARKPDVYPVGGAA